MEQSHFWEANMSSDSQEFTRILWNPEGSLPHSQASASCPYFEPDQSIQRPHPTSWISILILFSHLHLGVLRMQDSTDPKPMPHIDLEVEIIPV